MPQSLRCFPRHARQFARAIEQPGNPSSAHADGRRARALLEEARRTIAEALGWRHDVILTSGGERGDPNRVHPREVQPAKSSERQSIEAVVAAMGPAARELPVDANGLIDLNALKAALADEPALVAVQLVNNETGVIQPLDRHLRSRTRLRLASALPTVHRRQGRFRSRMPISS